MNPTQTDMNNFVNQYSFVKTELDRNDPQYARQRAWEAGLMSRQRYAVNFCKRMTLINTNDLSKIGNEEKEAMETCLRENFLNSNPKYFGNRDTVILDLN